MSIAIPPRTSKVNGHRQAKITFLVKTFMLRGVEEMLPILHSSRRISSRIGSLCKESGNAE